ncbi:MAG: hypothetical protein HYZ47_01675 [Simkania negevensis]|nr:hypothetical protein [Simkania negevensis]
MSVTPISTVSTGAYISFSAEQAEMVKKLKRDPYWLDVIENPEERLGNKEQPYILSQGNSPHVFVLYYLKDAEVVEKAEFFLEQSSGAWFYKNATDHSSADFREIIHYIMQPH